MIWLETAASFIMGTIGTYMLIRGKKIQQPKMMLWGAVLLVLSYFLFAGWGKDDDPSKAVLKVLVPGSSESQTPQP